MYGPGTAPPQSRPAGRAVVIGLRVLFAVLPVVTVGLGAWGSVLRLAMARRRRLDWALTPVAVAAATGGFVLLVISPGPDAWQSDVGAAVLLACMFLTPVYFLISDIRGTPPRPPSSPTAVPHPPQPYPPHRIPGAPPYGYGRPGPGAPAVPADPMPPAPPAAPRLDQVRAELDELSDFLRKEEGR
jgi:hypothetical protein